MSFWTLIVRSLRFHLRSHIGAFLGAVVSAAVLIGALVVGDSVRGSLTDLALSRIGKIQLALVSSDRLFRAALADDLERSSHSTAASILMLPGTTANEDGSARANRVQVIGVDDRFWSMAPQSAAAPKFVDDGALINNALARQLKVQAGNTILLRVPKPSSLSRDAPLAPDEDATAAMRVKIQAVVDDQHFGRFSLQANQAAPFNAFLPLKFLQEKCGVTNRANVLLVAGDKLSTDSAQRSLDQSWQLDDAELELRSLPETSEVELRTSRVFLEQPLAASVTAAVPGSSGILTYFVNELKSGTNTTPYSMVAAATPPRVPANLKSNEIVLNQWVADDLSAAPGAEIELRYYTVGSMRNLEERTAKFRVHSVVPMGMPFGDRTLMPQFPGLANAASCRDWDAGFPIKLETIRDKDQRFWDEHRGTPKAFISLEAGQQLWTNRFGNLTALRWKIATNASTTLAATHDSIQSKLRAVIKPSDLGLTFSPIKEQALSSSGQSQDFGGLFIGFSFFLIIAALLLMVMLFQFSIEQRGVEVGTLLALGFTPKQVRRLLLVEGAGIALAGTLVGVGGGLLYSRAMLFGLTTIWLDAAGLSTLQLHIEPATLGIGIASAFFVAMISIWLGVRRQARQPARELLAGVSEDFASPEMTNRHLSSEGLPLPVGEGRGEGNSALCTLHSALQREGRGEGIRVEGPRVRRRLQFSKWLAPICLLAAIGMVTAAIFQNDTSNAETFFTAGMLLLIGGMALSSRILTRLQHSEAAERLTLTAMSVRNVTRRRRRSLSIVGLLASASFLIASMGAFRLDAAKDAFKRSSGTGGFALIGESSLPIVRDLNSKSGREFYGVDEALMKDVKIVPMRVHEGDEASCLNLNRAQRPRLLGLQPELLALRDAFTFAEVANGGTSTNQWLELKKSRDGNVTFIGDAASIQWAMGKKVGGTIDYPDEHGKNHPGIIVGGVANSILQGNLLMSEDNFTRMFPSESGYKFFLIDTPKDRVEQVSVGLSKALRDFGFQMTPATTRLATFNAVQNTYLGTFQLLGGLGLLLGSVGLGVVVLRNVFERRGELALLRAVGFTPKSLKWMVASEHGVLLLAGLFLGVVSAALAVLPSILTPRTGLPGMSLTLTLSAVVLSGLIWTTIATMIALRGRLIDALRNE